MKQENMSTSANNSPKTPYIFWFYRIDRRMMFNRPSFNRDVWKCTVDNSVIEFSGSKFNDPIKIQIDSIKECNINFFISSTQNTVVTINLFDARPIHISFAHPLKPHQSLFTNDKESKVFVKVVNSIMKEKRIPINPNPYLRAFEYMGKQPEPSDETRDPHVNPWVYHERYRRKYSTKEKILIALLIIVSLPTTILLVGLIADALLN